MGGKHRYLGIFPGTPEGEVAAALAWDRAAFEVYGEDVIIQPGGFTPYLESGQDADGCTNCRAAVGYYNEILTAYLFDKPCFLRRANNASQTRFFGEFCQIQHLGFNIFFFAYFILKINN